MNPDPKTPPTEARPRSITRRLTSFTLGLVVAAFLLELLLQASAYIIFLSRPESAERGIATHLALCVGDSFTFGLGRSSEDTSYPAVVQALADRDPDLSLQVVNAGVPGQSSRDVLARLPEQISDYGPDLVYVLVGTNDFLMRPALLQLEEGDVHSPGFPLRWRTRRMVRVFVDWLGEGEPDTAVAGLQEPLGDDFRGVWHSESLEVEFALDSTLRFGTERFQWRVDEADGLQLQLTDGRNFPIEWQRRGRRLTISCPLWAQTYLLEPGPLPTDTPASILVEHLRQIADRCRNAGARCTLLNYPGGPFSKPGLNELLSRTAQDLGLEFLDVDAHFAKLRATGDGDSYYAPDGHCSDRGYAEIADLVFAHARRSLR